MIPWLSATNHCFPAINTALLEPNGLLAAGGDLTPERLIKAYRSGIFPWFSEGEPILWWSPAPRCVLPLEKLHISKSLAKLIRKNHFKVSIDTAFREVIEQCSAMRKHQEGTWITPEMQQAYIRLHSQNIAHSVEVWHQDQLVGGLYGLAIGNIFFGESMFSKQSNTSKIAFCFLVNQLKEWKFSLIDCQVHSDHLESLGAIEIDRVQFAEYLANIDN
jgi:leucyl/phenylalanyl-tRNA--protein transferase